MKTKITSLLLAGCMLLGMGGAAFATEENYPVDVELIPIEDIQEIIDNSLVDASGTGNAYLPQNNTAGTNGNPCAPFTADKTSVTFSLTSAPGASTYNVQLYAGSPGSGYKVSSPASNIPVNIGVSFTGLTVGQSYYFVISSNTVGSGGCTCTYNYVTY